MSVSGDYSSNKDLGDGDKTLKDIFGLRKAVLLATNFADYFKSQGAEGVRCSLLPVVRMQRAEAANPKKDISFSPGLPYFASPSEPLENLQRELTGPLEFKNIEVRSGGRVLKAVVKVRPQNISADLFQVEIETIVGGSVATTKDIGLLPKIIYQYKSGQLSTLLVPTDGLTGDVEVRPSVIPYTKI